MHRLVFVVGIALSSVGCVESALNPEDSVALTGQVFDESGAPLKGEALQLDRSSNSSCLFDKAYESILVSEDGTFAASLTGRETRNGEIARCFALSLAERAEGRSAHTRFLIQVTDVQVPELRLWKGGLTEEKLAGGGVRLNFVAHPKDAKPRLTLKTGEETAYEQFEVATGTELSAYMLEDFELSAALQSTIEHKGSGTTFTHTLKSDRLALTKGTLIPATRGASCTYTGGVGPCPLTDGKLAAIALSENDRNVVELTIQLATPKTLTRAVLRNLAFSGQSAVLEGSSDGASWTKLAELSAPVSTYHELALANAKNIKQLRLRATSADPEIPSMLRHLSELSAFE